MAALAESVIIVSVTMWQNWLSAPLPRYQYWSGNLFRRHHVSTGLLEAIALQGQQVCTIVIFSGGDVSPLISFRSVCPSSCSWCALISAQWLCSHSHVRVIFRCPVDSSARLWLHWRRLEYPSENAQTQRWKDHQGKTLKACCCGATAQTTAAPCCPC